MQRPFRERAVDSVSALGSYLIAHCEEIVGTIDMISEIEIRMTISGGGPEIELPSVTVTHRYIDKQITNSYLGKEVWK